MEEAADRSVDIVAVRVHVLWPPLMVSNPAPSKAVRDSWRVTVTERRCAGQSPAGPVQVTASFSLAVMLAAG